MKNSFSVILFLIFISSGLFSQNTLSNCYCWTPVDLSDTSFHIVPFTEGVNVDDKGIPPDYYNDDGSTKSIKLPFHFCFYGKNYDTIFINNNGNISFVKPISNYIQGKFPFGTDSLMIAPFYSDVYTWGGNKLVGGDRVFSHTTPTHMILKWNKVGFYFPGDNDEFDSFQLIMTNGADSILPAGNNLAFCYGDMLMWATSSDTSGFGGFPCTIGINKGNKTDFAQIGNFALPGTQFLGPFAANNGVGWLKNKSFVFNTCVTGNTIPPVIINDHTCDTVTVCAGDSLEFTTAFLSAQQTQTCTLSFSSPGLNGVYQQGINTIHSVSDITIMVKPTEADTGTHILNVIATDNSSPALTNKYPVTIVVKFCGVGINEINSKNNFNIYPNPSSGRFSIQGNSPELIRNSEVKIYDILGNNIYSTTINALKTEINLSSRPKGIYFIKIFKGDIPAGVEKIVIDK